MSELLHVARDNCKNFKEKKSQIVEDSINIIKKNLIELSKYSFYTKYEFLFSNNNFVLNWKSLKESSYRVKKYFTDIGFNVVQKKSGDCLIISYNQNSEGEFIEELLDNCAKCFFKKYDHDGESITMHNLIQSTIENIKNSSSLGANSIETQLMYNKGIVLYKYFDSLGFKVSYKYIDFWDKIFSLLFKDFNKNQAIKLKISW